LEARKLERNEVENLRKAEDQNVSICMVRWRKMAQLFFRRALLIRAFKHSGLPAFKPYAPGSFILYPFSFNLSPVNSINPLNLINELNHLNPEP